MRYIELNPLRAGMVSHPGEYQWSSYARNATGSDDDLVAAHPVFASLASEVEMRCYCYRELFKSHMEDSDIHEIRAALSQELVLGRDDFKSRIEEMTQR
jgi:putative transposase